ncbi:MAG: phosphatase PAP2 family protein [Crocinitomicaceae bacterium]|jgi:undecaprenyl-diphosphatase|nr:phosphatase PAP2 family protein [Crocinitomicaceae bacterium]MDP4723043.1 phosphatase PAP2 family protein [Crocinitomicaceae bacterium]MDP4739630.1 phosphatase PAP2 family protein [Crocinitomicaceae bacterium]MDP4800319.1 phosphatase PAP2 family protein [Crocinitomicaceae bacterium]MDP4806653.1 phosphatase PAP2 family protein [Crocinitomicaceae bacterium]
MIEFLFRLDYFLLLRINALHAPWLDEIMWVFSSKWINFPLALLILLLLKSQFSWKKTSLIFLSALVVVSLTDVISTQVFKDYFERLRPSHDPSVGQYLHFYMIGPNDPYLGGKFGFVSSHAANLAAMFVFVLPYLKKYAISIYGLGLYVFLVAYSRVYLGVHFPADVFCGALLGALIGWLFRRHLFAQLIAKWD